MKYTVYWRAGYFSLHEYYLVVVRRNNDRYNLVNADTIEQFEQQMRDRNIKFPK